ncbi:MAG: hypothetical protein WC679_01555 [Bacteroidales bacterium]|jgi:hypothetical protein
MTDYTVEIIGYNDLSEQEQKNASNNGWGKEDANYIKISFKGVPILIESDAMEPEDATLSRDLSWVKSALEEAYHLGTLKESDNTQENNIINAVNNNNVWLNIPPDVSINHEDNVRFVGSTVLWMFQEQVRLLPKYVNPANPNQEVLQEIANKIKTLYLSVNVNQGN